jgi:mevalonate kinase
LPDNEYYSKGKFLLTGEYLVLQGASALAVPLKFGQKMNIVPLQEKGIIKWETFVQDQPWFSGVFNLKNFNIIESSNQQTALFVRKLLQAGNELQPGFLTQHQGFSITNFLDFDINWGLGSSSSLLSNFAWWLGISPFALYRKLYLGSGYDVFCSRAEKPILYQLNKGLPVFRETDFKPEYSGQVFFIYLGRKQDSQKSVHAFLSKPVQYRNIIKRVSTLSNEMIGAESLDAFMQVMQDHETLMSAVLGIKPVKDDLFPDFPGEIKSLGAWGGDFVMAATKMSSEDVVGYFGRKNMQTVFKWDEIVY